MPISHKLNSSIMKIYQAHNATLTENLKRNRTYTHLLATNKWTVKDVETEMNMMIISVDTAKRSRTIHELLQNHLMNPERGQDILIEEKIADLGIKEVDLEFHLGQELLDRV